MSVSGSCECAVILFVAVISALIPVTALFLRVGTAGAAAAAQVSLALAANYQKDSQRDGKDHYAYYNIINSIHFFIPYLCLLSRAALDAEDGAVIRPDG